MNVQDLIKALSEFPPTMEIVIDVYSDYGLLESDGLQIINGIFRKSTDYVQRAYGDLENSPDVKPYLRLTSY